MGVCYGGDEIALLSPWKFQKLMRQCSFIKTGIVRTGRKTKGFSDGFGRNNEDFVPLS